MVSVRRVAPIILLAVTIPAWAVPQAATYTGTQAPASTTKKTTTTKSSAKKTTATSATTTPAPTPAPVTTPAPATKKAAKKKSTAKPAATTASKSAPKAKASRPPKNLHRVGDHWTAYNPPDPATYPAGAKTYAIKQGDTLWGLATQFYNNGYMWPQLWEANTWITDAHWIYPGDVLLLEGEISQQAEAGLTTGTGTTGTGTTGGTSTGGTGAGTSGNPLGGQTVRPLITAADAVGGTAGPVPLATEADVYCYGYIGDPNEPLPNAIAMWEDAELRYQPGTVLQETKPDGSEGDLAFIAGGESTGLVAGETYMLVAPRNLISHPRSHEILGRQYDYIGQVKVLCLDGDLARGLITKSCAEIPLGARLKPMPQLPIPLARIPSLPAFCDPQSGKARGYIISAAGGDWVNVLGEGYLVQINLGRDEQVLPGEFLTVFREGVQPGAPPQVLGEIAVLTAESHTATAKIVLMRYSMSVGDAVEIR